MPSSSMSSSESVISAPKICPILLFAKYAFIVSLTCFTIYFPLGDPVVECASNQHNRHVEYAVGCSFYRTIKRIIRIVLDLIWLILDPLMAILAIVFDGVISMASLLRSAICHYACESCPKSITSALEPLKEEIDKVIEDDITQRLARDLMQSLERKYQADLEKSVDMVLMKIKLLLQNGTAHIQDRLVALQNELAVIKQSGQPAVETCLVEHQNDTVALAEKALHQMVLCGYALIGHDPAHALTKVIEMKQTIKEGMKPIDEHKQEVFELLKLCGHDHDSLKKVIKCVISKSPTIKTSMMDVTGKLIDGVIQLTKLMAHGAMHEACLIEVVKTIEEEAITLVDGVRTCVYGNDTTTVNEEVKKYLDADNATVIEVPNREDKLENANNTEVAQMKDLIRRMLDKDEKIDRRFKKKLRKLEKHLRNSGVNQV